MSKHHHHHHKHQQANASGGPGNFPLVRTHSVERLNSHSADECETLVVDPSSKR